MINLKITDSVDPEKIGNYTFHKNLIYIGNKYSCDIYIKDNSIISNHIFIEVIEQRLLVHLNKEIDFILINGKRTTGHKYVGVGETISIGKNTFTIEAFNETIWETMKERVNLITDNLIKEKSDLLSIVSSLQKEDI